MAQIYEARSKNREKLDAYIGQSVEQQRSDYEANKKAMPMRRMIALVITAASLGAIAALLFKEGLMSSLWWGFVDILGGWYDALWAIGSDGKTIFHLALMLICRIPALVLLVLISGAPIVVSVVLYGGLGAIAFFAGTYILDSFEVFSEEKAVAVAESRMDSEMHRIKAGVEGEELALTYMQALDDSCHVFANVEIEFDNGRNEFDLIVVSPSGVTTVEVKNYSGTLIGDLSDPKFIKRKYRKNGEYSEDEESNPVQQSRIAGRRLENYLKSQGIRVNLRRCALFMNDNVKFQLTDHQGVSGTCPMFLGYSQDFLNYVYPGGTRPRASGEVSRIVDALKKQM